MKRSQTQNGAVLSLLLTLAGCAATPEAGIPAGPGTPELTIFSEPEGARIFDLATGAELGNSPLTLPVAPEDMREAEYGSDCYLTKGIAVRWPSGAEETHEPTITCGRENSLLISRSCADPGREQDEAAALAAIGRRTPAQQRLAEDHAGARELAYRQGLPQLDPDGEISEAGYSPFCE